MSPPPRRQPVVVLERAAQLDQTVGRAFETGEHCCPLRTTQSHGVHVALNALRDLRGGLERIRCAFDQQGDDEMAGIVVAKPCAGSSGPPLDQVWHPPCTRVVQAV